MFFAGPNSAPESAEPEKKSSAMAEGNPDKQGDKAKGAVNTAIDNASRLGTEVKEEAAESVNKAVAAIEKAEELRAKFHELEDKKKDQKDVNKLASASKNILGNVAPHGWDKDERGKAAEPVPETSAVVSNVNLNMMRVEFRIKDASDSEEALNRIVQTMNNATPAVRNQIVARMESYVKKVGEEAKSAA